MQLHSLAFAAIGPFRDEQRIDFGQLAAGGLFLLDGPTGAGKSTVIDAVVFALYGDVAGGGSSKNRLVSDHRETGAEPFVDLVFETGAGVLRVRRTPEYERPKKRGEGTVTQQATVKLWKATSPDALDGDPISTRAGEADAEIRDALGLSREQFVKTVVLPQGEFARFLQARGDERRDILQSIFGTEHYDRVQDELKRRRSQAREAGDEADRRLRFAGETFARVAELDDDAVARLDVLVEAVLGAVAETRDECEDTLTSWTDEIVDGLRTTQHDLTGRRATVESARDDAVAEHQDRQRRRELRDRLRSALAERKELDDEADEHRHREQRLDAARRASTCRVAFEGLDDAKTRLEHVTRQVGDLRATVQLDGLDITVAARDDVARAHRELLDTLVGLADMHELEAGLAARRDEMRTLHAGRHKLADDVAEIDETCARLPAEIEALRTQSATAAETAAAVPGLRQELADVDELLAVHEQLESARKHHVDADAECRAALEQVSVADAHVSELRRRYLEGIAADLAVDLAEGTPCQVCGATEHPQPASHAEGAVAREQVDEAERSCQQAQDQLERCRQSMSTTATTVAELEGRLDGSTLDALRTRRDSIRTAITEGETAEKSAAELSDTIKRREEALTNGLEQQKQANTDLARLEARIAGLTERIEADEERVRSERRDHPTVSARVNDLRRRASEAERLATALADLENRTADHRNHADQLERAVAEAGFDSAEAALAALLPASGIESLRERVDEWSRRSHAVDGRLADPELIDVDPEAEVDVDAAKDLRDTREAELLDLQRAIATGDDRLERSRTAADDVAQATTARRHAHDTSAPITRLAGLANADSADNAMRMALATYVLQRRFDGVVAAANERLADMSSGRYTLESHGDRQSGSRRTGLGLRVVDAHTGRVRDTGTLSGGETFYVSLALALGLADVVTFEAGGLRMGTLFVDEGFGSLDPETLDDVMGVLAALRNGGRVVGVVSHVEELKIRIPERIDVRRPAAGGPSMLSVVA